MVPEGWKVVALGDHIDLLTGFPFKSKHYSNEATDVCLLRGDNIQPGNFRWQNVQRWPKSDLQTYEKYRLAEGDFVIAMDRTWISTGLKVAEVTASDLPCLLVQRVARIRTKRTLEQRLVKHYLSGHRFKQYVKSVQTETAVPHISPTQIREFDILLPPRQEQGKIADLLATWDKAIATTERLLANSEKQKKALMQQLLTGKKRLPGFSGEWKRKRIRDIATRITRKSDGCDHPILTISSLSGFVRQDEKFSRYMAGESVNNYILLRKGEFAYNKGNSKTYQFGCVFDLENFDTGLVPHVYVCFKLKDGYSRRFYKYLFEADYLKPQLGRLVNTGVRNNGLLNIKPSEFLDTKVPTPSFPEQEKLADVLEAATREILSLKAKIAALQTEKNALMQQLLTGKRRVKVEAPQKEAAHG